MSKRDMEKKLEEQHRQILLYEKRIKDLVNAYKSLDAEKNALQTVVETFEGSATDQPVETSEEGAPTDNIESLKQSLGTLTREKLKREKAFQNDKKALLTENETLKQQLKKAADDAEGQADKTAAVIRTLSEKVKQIEADRERELTDHGSVLAEMQRRYAKEKVSAENAHKQLVELYKKLQDKEELPSQFKSKEKDYDSQIAGLKEQIADWKGKATRTPAIQLLQDQMTNMKADHAREIEDLKNSGLHTTHTDRQSILRINELETSVHSLSERIAEYERERHENLEQLKRQKDENKSLEQKVSELEASVVSKSAEKPTVEDVQTLVQALSKQGVNVFDYLNDPRVAETKARLEKIKDEFERYKLKAEAVLKAKAAPTTVSTEDAGLRALVNQLHDKLRNLEVSHGADQAQYEMTTRLMRERITELEKSEELCRNEMRQEMQKKISEMESEMQKQRSRTLDVLAEKERELEATKRILVSLRSEQLNTAPVDPPQAGKIHLHKRHSKTDVKRYLDRKISSGSRRSADAISVSSMDYGPSDANNLSFPNVNESRNIFYEDEIAKKDKEVVEMRNALHQLEYRMRDMEQSSLCKDLQHHEMAEKLKEEIRVLEGKLRLMSTESGSDIEYLRNIFVQYVNSSNASGRKNILKAIGMVLKLSPNEMKAIDRR